MMVEARRTEAAHMVDHALKVEHTAAHGVGCRSVETAEKDAAARDARESEN